MLIQFIVLFNPINKEGIKIKMEEYISFELAKEVNDTLGYAYCYARLPKIKKCWRYPTSGNGGHPRGPYIDDIYYDDDPFDEYDDTWFAFSWKELYNLMNAYVVGDYRKVEFECIEDINEFAMKLSQYIKEKEENSLCE